MMYKVTKKKLIALLVISMFSLFYLLTFEDEADRFSCNVGKELPLFTA